jgi:HPt (histidine-containing phosphotransfer) domain-containing protein
MSARHANESGSPAPGPGDRAGRPDRPAEASPLISQFSDDADMGELIEFFINELTRRTGEMERALAEGRLSDLGRIAHQIKGAAGGYGFPAISQCADELEQAIRAAPDGRAETEGVRRRVAALTTLCQRASIGFREDR